MIDLFDKDKLEEECGVYGIYNREKEIESAQFVYYGLYALQHRGQESAGIATNKDGKIQQHKGMGLVSEIFRGNSINELEGNIGIGHVRYSTTGESHIENAQPLVVNYKNSQIALAHNGNLVNARALREMLEDNGVVFQTTIDSEVIVNLIARGLKNGIVESIKRMVEIIKGAYALVITTEDKLIGIRDPHGLRPLCLGKTKTGGYVLASESCALDSIGAKLIRDIDPGEIVIIDQNGVKSYSQNNWVKKRLCIFELIYFARPDSVIDGISVYLSRHNAGKILAAESMVNADVVIGVPDSGIPAAIGFAEASGIPFGIGLIKNKYTGRTFIQPSQELREEGVRLKLNALKENVQGKRVVIVDDSIVRGTTSKHLVELLREAGATEVHFRVSSPPVAHTCHFGIDTPYRKHLVGAMKTVEEIRDMIGADTLAFISVEGLVESVGGGTTYCRACFDGDYPMEVPVMEE
ncbi:amidophosphoribosyltransferase [Alkalibacter saccharofermentans]|uniref:Amidophosphoribosyltransferase n=1 Tax=Alkalibacter saccharofermentans DSM 14828 TaxID=1120975 RepID=A0A1M4YDK8_9FIRM|nr:amidophosphoribosyltransferase [Alkalibacter saccharofermentans]SHF03815.1 amidophosphoribosyltransferase [Alkalibacter saccharofermentans DSM 14828]